MAVADYSTDFTSRYRVTYRAGGVRHTQTWRLGIPPVDTSILAEMQAAVTAYWDALAPQLSQDFSLIDVSIAQAGDKWFAPVASALWPVVPAALDLNPTAIDDGLVPAFLRWSYRTVLGNAGSVVQYGVTISPNTAIVDDFTVTAADLPLVNDVVAILESTPIISGIDGAGVVWRPYANYGYNSGWQQALRSL